MNSQIKTFGEYVKLHPKNVQLILKKIRDIVRSGAPNAVESISYGMPAFKLNGKPLVYFGAYEKHIGFYPTPSGTANFKKELSQYKSGKGSAQFQLDQPMPFDLMQRIVEFRVKENNKLKKKK
ncbi:MAG TPA: DUF1801 domain-containing protein [Candidatus Magasanikbacteria bacterium]|nr:DUF1801 domain-containing protein [Candidatus Magasanikbacteria bacterium]